MQKITNYFYGRLQNATNLGLIPSQRPETARERESEVQRIAGVLRDRYLSKPAAAAAE